MKAASQIFRTMISASMILICCSCSLEISETPQVDVCSKILYEPNCDTLELDSYYVGEKLGVKATLLFFHTGWCGPCIVEGIQLPSLAKEYGTDVSFISAVMEDPVRASNKTAVALYACAERKAAGSHKGLDFHYDVDYNGILWHELRIDNYVPFNVVLDSQCNIVNKIVGAEMDLIRATLDQVVGNL